MDRNIEVEYWKRQYRIVIIGFLIILGLLMFVIWRCGCI